MSEIVEFYDKFSARQAAAGINNRHISIHYHLVKAGLRNFHHVLEVGCGIGTVSQLILRTLTPRGSLYAVDISPKSIMLAKQTSLKYENAVFQVKDLTKEKVDRKFDVIVLPDVIEHIPFELYPTLFRNLYEMLDNNGFVLIHIPHPNYLEWLIQHGSTELQVIDNPVHTDKLLNAVYPVGFYLKHLKSYCIYKMKEDYQVIILEKNLTDQTFDNRKTFFRLPIHVRFLNKFKYLLRGFK